MQSVILGVPFKAINGFMVFQSEVFCFISNAVEICKGGAEWMLIWVDLVTGLC